MGRMGKAHYFVPREHILNLWPPKRLIKLGGGISCKYQLTALWWGFPIHGQRWEKVHEKEEWHPWTHSQSRNPQGRPARASSLELRTMYPSLHCPFMFYIHLFSPPALCWHLSHANFCLLWARIYTELLLRVSKQDWDERIYFKDFFFMAEMQFVGAGAASNIQSIE